ncbi:MAG: transglutaminase family protein [Moritella sp.]|uniref:transglutaminase-like domain-containing protein n=1 Tax=Moritella sp. TaxID=78556 RepID=UPI0029B607FC|nr:transglutaminase family protein [Moritella sp.]MDX2322272.1 transglutaminase family protein [Moritella sp.]
MTINQAYLQTTPMLDYLNEDIQQLITLHGWRDLSQYDAIGAVYNFVRDDITFGYNRDDTLTASQVLKDGYGQCNTKGTLLMALLRALSIQSRFHGFTIYNQLQQGAIPSYLFFFSPQKIIHSWVEIYFAGRWLNLEGYIIDRQYLTVIQAKFADNGDTFSGFGIATKCLKKPANEWQGNSTYIQKEGIADDFGVYSQPDDFYNEKGSNLTGIKKLIFRYLLRHLMNKNVDNIRNEKL